MGFSWLRRKMKEKGKKADLFVQMPVSRAMRKQNKKKKALKNVFRP